MDSAKKKYNFQAGEVLLVNKPLNWTSFDVVNKLRYHIKQKLGVKKIKVGHAGTLDPLADGLLIICTGKKTKSIESYMGLEKTYSGSITLGGTTPSYDLETEVDQKFDISDLNEESIRALALEMTGDQEQMPPIFSAKKIKGQKAYDLARAGKEVKLSTKKVHISKFEIKRIELPKVTFLIKCSKGTYIRSIAHDFGQNLNNGGHLSSLRREAIGQFNLEKAFSIEQWLEIIDNSEMDNNSMI